MRMLCSRAERASAVVAALGQHHAQVVGRQVISRADQQRGLVEDDRLGRGGRQVEAPLPGHGGVQFAQGIEGHRARHFMARRRAELLLGEGEVGLQRQHGDEVLGRGVLQHGGAVAGDDGGQIEVGLQLPAGGEEIARLLQGRQARAERPAVVDRVAFDVEALGHQPQGGDELGPRGVVGPAIGQLEAVADLLVGLPGGPLQLFAPRGGRLRGQQQRGPRVRQGPQRTRRSGRRRAAAAGRLPAAGRPGAGSSGPLPAAAGSALAGMLGKAAASTAGSPAARAGFSGLAVSGKVFPRTAGRPSASAAPVPGVVAAGVGWAMAHHLIRPAGPGPPPAAIPLLTSRAKDQPREAGQDDTGKRQQQPRRPKTSEAIHRSSVREVGVGSAPARSVRAVLVVTDRPLFWIAMRERVGPSGLAHRRAGTVGKARPHGPKNPLAAAQPAHPDPARAGRSKPGRQRRPLAVLASEFRQRKCSCAPRSMLYIGQKSPDD